MDVRVPLVVALGLSALGCEGPEVLFPNEAGCPVEAFGACVGATSSMAKARTLCRCDGDPVRVGDPAALTQALAGNPVCVALEPGSYGAIALPSGFQLRGSGPGTVTLTDLTLGPNAAACGLTVQGGGVRAQGPGGHLGLVAVLDSPGDGVRVEEGASLTVDSATIAGSGATGILATEADLTVMNAHVVDAGDGGIWVQNGDCTTGLGLTARLDHVLVEGAAAVGLVAFGAEVEVEGLVVRDAVPDQGFTGGGGIAFGACSVVRGRNVETRGHADYGFLADASTLELEGLSTADNFRGLFVQNLAFDQSGRINGLQATGNRALGAGFLGNRGEVYLRDADIRGTRSASIPVLVDGVSASVIDMADGLFWEGSGRFDFEGISVEDSDLRSVVIAGRANGRLHDVVPIGSDVDRGIVHVCDDGLSQLEVSGATPELRRPAADCYTPMKPSPGDSRPPGT